MMASSLILLRSVAFAAVPLLDLCRSLCKLLLILGSFLKNEIAEDLKIVLVSYGINLT